MKKLLMLTILEMKLVKISDQHFRVPYSLVLVEDAELQSQLFPFDQIDLPLLVQ
jgi:hypothetical protein